MEHESLGYTLTDVESLYGEGTALEMCRAQHPAYLQLLAHSHRVLLPHHAQHADMSTRPGLQRF